MFRSHCLVASSLRAAIILALVSLAWGGPTSQPSTSAPDVVVTANRSDTPAGQVGSSITVLSRQELEKKQIRTVAEALRTVPSVDVERSGGPNQITSVFMRGGSSAHTLVLIDGINVNDPTSPSRAFDFSALTLDNVERIEILRGPQSTLYGGSAMGGVINIITRRGSGPPNGYVLGEIGRYQSSREAAFVNGGNNRFDYSLGVSQAHSRGFSAADVAFGNSEPDGFDNSALSGRFGLNLSNELSIDFITRFQSGMTEIDDGGGLADDRHRRIRYSQQFFKIAPRLSLFDGKWEQNIGISATRYYRNDNDDQFPSDTFGGLNELQWQHIVRIIKSNTLILGADYQHEIFNSDTSAKVSADAIGLYVQDEQSFNDALFLTGGLRYDHHSSAGNAVTYRLTAAYLFPTQTKLRASYGTGFAPPSLIDLFGAFGTPTLQPEKSRGWDVGIEQSLWKDRLSFDVTFFRNDFRNLIQFNNQAGIVENIGSARTQGIEVGATWRVIDDLTLHAGYTYTDAHDLDTGKELVRRAPHRAEFDAIYSLNRKLDVALSAIYYSRRDDIDPVKFGRTTVDDYTLVNLAASYRFSKNLSIFGRIENLLDQKYEEVAGFGTSRLALYAGLKWNF